MADAAGPFFKYVCPTCGDDDCGYDATASWNVATQSLELGSHFDASWCNACGDVTLKKLEITAEQYAEAVAAQLAADQHPAMVALRRLIEAATAHDAGLNDDGQQGGSRCPAGEDYNDLYGLLDVAARAAGLPAII